MVWGPKLMASYFEWAFIDKRPDLANGSLHLRLSDNGSYRFQLPQTFSACRAVTLSDARDGWQSAPEKIIAKLHVHWGHPSAQQLGRVWAHSDSGNMQLFNYVDEASERCEVCRAFETAPHVPIAGTPAVSAFNGKLQVSILLLGDIIAQHEMDVYSKYSLSIPARPKNPQRVRAAFRGG